MFVSDIFDDAKEVLGLCSDTKVYSRLTDTVEALANKGQWDSLLTYLIIPTTGDLDIIGLPSNIDAVLRININGSPSFARDRMWEFTLNGPGSDDPRIGFQWEDQGDQLQGQEQPPGVPGGDTTIDPGSRIIRLSQKAVSVRALVRLKTNTITSKEDWIPLYSKLAVLLMLKAIENYRKGTPDTFQLGQAQEAQALKFLEEEQKSRNVFSDLSKAMDSLPIVGYTYHSNDVVVVADIYDEASEICGGIGEPHVLDRISEAIEVMSNKGQWDGLTAYLDMVPQSDVIGLPRQVEIPIRININSKPAIARSRMFEFSTNGPGTYLDEITTLTWEDQGSSSTIIPITAPGVIGVSGNQVDAGKLITIKGVDINGIDTTHDFTIPDTDQIHGGDQVVSEPPDSPIYPPSFIPLGGYGKLFPLRVVIFTADTEGGVIVYTLDGSDPSLTHGTNTGSRATEVPLSDDTTIKAIVARFDQGIISSINTQFYFSELPPPPPRPPPPPSLLWKSVERISKPETIWPVDVFCNSALIAYLYPDQTETSYRSIKLNKPADSIKILFRKSSIKITSQDDIIPIKSRASVLLMLRALQLYKAPNLSAETCSLAQQLEAQSLKFLQEEEQSKLGYIQASSKDVMPAIGINVNSRGVLTAGDVYDDAADIFGPIGRPRLFDKITDAMELLANKSQWDGLDGYVDIITDQTGYMTLPRRVEVPIGVNYCRTPAQMRSRWYEFNLNGLQEDSICGNYWDDMGEFPLVNEPSQAMKLFSTTITREDATVNMRAYGYNELGQWIRSWENGDLLDGEKIPVNYVDPDAPSPLQTTLIDFAQVTRITKDISKAPIQLFATGTIIPPPPPNPVPPSIQFLGLYDPDETEPMFRRIKIPTWVTWVRMRYRTTTLKITKMSDPLNLKSKVGLVTMMRAMKALEGGDLNAAEGFEKKAVQLISEEQMSRNPAETFELQYDQKTSWADPLQGTY